MLYTEKKTNFYVAMDILKDLQVPSNIKLKTGKAILLNERQRGFPCM